MMTAAIWLLWLCALPLWLIRHFWKPYLGLAFTLAAVLATWGVSRL